MVHYWFNHCLAMSRYRWFAKTKPDIVILAGVTMLLEHQAARSRSERKIMVKIKGDERKVVLERRPHQTTDRNTLPSLKIFANC